MPDTGSVNTKSAATSGTAITAPPPPPPKPKNTKRRPAIIPSSAELSSEDKQAIKLRTGRWPQLMHPAVSIAIQRAEMKHAIQVGVEEMKKRKPSTTAEQYHDKINDGGPMRKTPSSTTAG